MTRIGIVRMEGFNVLADAGALGISYFNTSMCGSAKLLMKNEGRILNFLRAYLGEEKCTEKKNVPGVFSRSPTLKRHRFWL